MKQITSFAILVLSINAFAQEFDITQVTVEKDAELQQMIFTIAVSGQAGDSVPTAIGQLDGAPVLGYVFPTTLASIDVGFDATDGIVALALTSHPDFDDTPLWDEDYDGDYANDGVIWHSHWVLLEENTNVPGGLAVKATTGTSVLPPTNPGMPMYMDSPGHPVVLDQHKIRCAIPLYRMNGQEAFNYDGVTALMYVNTSDPDLPMLGVYAAYNVASGDLSLPYTVGSYSCDTLNINVSVIDGLGHIDPEVISIYPNPASTELHLDLSAGLDLGAYEVQIYDGLGSLVHQESLNASNVVIQLSDIGSAGTYTVSIVETGTGIVKGSKQLILQ